LGYARAGSNPARVVADTMSEWLRSRPAKPVCFARVGSNPTCVDIHGCGVMVTCLPSKQAPRVRFPAAVLY
tara:strand:+ start:2280 stop:2492 length:213 start_codon:yes stop_codon:yes gene_type:complete